jgi:hypothetical protein
VVLLVKVPKSRPWVSGAIGLACIAGYLIYESQQSAEAARRTRAKASDIQLQDIEIGEYLGNYKVTGRARNLSGFALTEFSIKVTVSDCAGGTCETVAEGSTWSFTAPRIPEPVNESETAGFGI